MEFSRYTRVEPDPLDFDLLDDDEYLAQIEADFAEDFDLPYQIGQIDSELPIWEAALDQPLTEGLTYVAYGGETVAWFGGAAEVGAETALFSGAEIATGAAIAETAAAAASLGLAAVALVGFGAYEFYRWLQPGPKNAQSNSPNPMPARGPWAAASHDESVGFVEPRFQLRRIPRRRRR